MSFRRAFIAASASLLVVLVSPAAGRAVSRDPSAVSLSASATSVDFGDAVTLSATVSPATAGEAVSILDAGGATLASGTTTASGTFSADVKPGANLVAHATSGGVDSATVSVGVRPLVTLRSSSVRLFGTLEVHGTFHPARSGVAVAVDLQHGGEVVATKQPKMDAGGSFSTAFRVMQPGSYRVRAYLDAPDLYPGRAATTPSTTPLPDLASGARGLYVSLLEHRLVELHYHLVAVDQVFDYRTADAVMAFRKVQGLPRTQDVNVAVWHALASPKLFVPRNHQSGFHIEVDQTRQVLATVKDGKVQAIFHVSTGKASTPTRDGTFHVTSKLAGFSPKGLYYPSFFDGERAIHGWTDVPNYPASHGCVRVPYWIATWIFGLDPVGTPVVIYH